MAAHAQGDRKAFDALFRVLAPRVYGFFMRKFANAAVADDLLQITFMKVHQARKDYRFGAPVRPWVFTIAARVGLDELRRRGRRPEDADEARLDKATRRAAMAAATGPDALEQADVATRVLAALGELPESQRVVVHLHRYEGLTFSEIGGILGTSEGAVKLRAFRAYERLRESLASLFAELRGREE